jgi:membrane associated rhomboid family serine protease
MAQYRTPGFGSLPPVVKNLLIINVLMLAAAWLVRTQFQIDLNGILGLYYFESANFRPYQIATHMFMHGGLMHLFFNMFALWMFGRVLESVWGGKRFLIYYFITGLGAAALHTFVNFIEFSSLQNAAELFAQAPSADLYAEFIKKHVSNPNPGVFDFINRWASNPNNPEYASSAMGQINNYIQSLMNIPTVGASGAVFGVLLAFGMLFPNTQLLLLFPPIPIKAKYFVLIYAGLEIYLGFTQPGSNIAHFAHIGGMLFGFILIKFWNRDKRTFF